MSENIVILSGSPRKKGNTERLTAAFIEGAKAAGKHVTLFRTAEMTISGCKGCMHCTKEKGVCIQKDDMSAILEALQEADALVLASPVYFFDITAQLKLAIDRLYALIPLLGTGVSIKKSALLMTCGAASQEVAEGAVTIYKNICSNAKWEDAGKIIATGLINPGDIDEHVELARARILGQEI